MKIHIALTIAAFCTIGLSHRGFAFSLLGPLQNHANGAADPWQGKPYGGRPSGLGYSLPGDIGGPMLIQESYRWNIPVITYGFDPEFVEYFGQAGVDEVEKAIAIFNALPPVSAMSATLEEFPLDAKGQNGTGSTLSLMDLKSHVLPLLLEQLGLAMPERFVWSLRSRNASPTGTNYAVLNLNYDPITWQASQRVNGVIYNYRVFDDLGPRGEEWASAVEWYQLDPDFQPYSSVAGGVGSRDYQMGSDPSVLGASSGLLAGHYFTGLTRDDVGGLRFLLSRENRRWEALLPGVTGVGSNAAGFVSVALRPGVEKLTFQRQQFAPATQQFQPVTNIFQDIYFMDDAAVTQTVQRVVTTPDILFRVRDLGGVVYHWDLDEGQQTIFAARLYDRSDASAWLNHAGLNDRPSGAGPGVIRPPAHITFNKVGRYLAAGGGGFTPLWAAFDGSDAPPVWFMGSDTNINSLVVESRVVRTNGIAEFEWTTLRFNHHPYRVEVSTNLINWTLYMHLEPNSTGGGNAFTLRHPITARPHFFRSIKEPWIPPE